MGDIIKRLEAYRLEHKITQQELARILEVNFTTINHWLNYKHKPMKIHIYHIKKLLKKGARHKKPYTREK